MNLCQDKVNILYAFIRIASCYYTGLPEVKMFILFINVRFIRSIQAYSLLLIEFELNKNRVFVTFWYKII